MNYLSGLEDGEVVDFISENTVDPKILEESSNILEWFPTPDMNKFQEKNINGEGVLVEKFDNCWIYYKDRMKIIVSCKVSQFKRELLIEQLKCPTREFNEELFQELEYPSGEFNKELFQELRYPLREFNKEFIQEETRNLMLDLESTTLDLIANQRFDSNFVKSKRGNFQIKIISCDLGIKVYVNSNILSFQYIFNNSSYENLLYFLCFMLV